MAYYHSHLHCLYICKNNLLSHQVIEMLVLVCTIGNAPVSSSGTGHCMCSVEMWPWNIWKAFLKNCINYLLSKSMLCFSPNPCPLQDYPESINSWRRLGHTSFNQGCLVTSHILGPLLNFWVTDAVPLLWWLAVSLQLNISWYVNPGKHQHWIPSMTEDSVLSVVTHLIDYN